jgi:CRISPR-associated protein Cas2
MFDLPVTDREKMRRATAFRNLLLDKGFTMKQFSVYIKPVTTLRSAKMLVRKLSFFVPDGGLVSFMYITDKQYVQTENFIGKEPAINEEIQRRENEHYSLFD